MKLLKSSGCLFSDDGGNVKEQTMIVEEQGIGFRTGVRLPSAPLDDAKTNTKHHNLFIIKKSIAVIVRLDRSRKR